MESISPSKVKEQPVHANPTGLPVIPQPPIPKRVLESSVGEQTLPPELGLSKTALATQFDVKPDISEEEAAVVKEKEKEVETEPKGVITIRLYKHRPYEVDFEGTITGADRDIAWRAMMKQYMQWKAKLAKQGGK